MDDQLARQFQLRNAPQVFLENGRLDFQLMFVAGVLVVASTAAREIRTSWINAGGRRFENLLDSSSRKSGSLFDEGSVDPLSLENKRQEDRLAASMLVRRQTSQSIAAINQLLNFKFQASILTKARLRGHSLRLRAGQALSADWLVEAVELPENQTLLPAAAPEAHAH